MTTTGRCSGPALFAAALLLTAVWACGSSRARPPSREDPSAKAGAPAGQAAETARESGGAGPEEGPRDEEKARKGKEEKREIILRTEAHDEQAGEEGAVEAALEFGIVDDPELVAYVGAVGRRLLRHAPSRSFGYRFQIVDQDAPNAFALPGGYVFVSRGLLALANSEDELANVLGHEIVHVALRHSAGRQSRVLGIPGPFRFFALGDIARYTRDQEREADRLGQELAARAGYDPRAMATFLVDLDHGERLELGVSRLPGFLDTHPVTGERVATASARSDLIRFEPLPGIARNRAEYLRRIEGVAVGMRATEGVFHGNHFLHPDLDFAMSFPAGWETRNTRRAVGAFERRRSAVVYLEHQGPGDDPAAAAATYLEEEGDELGLRVERSVPVKLGEVAAYRSRGLVGVVGQAGRFVITWIAHEGSIYRLTGVSPPGPANRFEGTFTNVARSFRPLTAAERASIRETRLRVVAARPGETLAELGTRTANQWNVQQTAVMNDLFASERLRGGELVKIAALRAYGDGDGDARAR